MIVLWLQSIKDNQQINQSQSLRSKLDLKSYTQFSQIFDSHLGISTLDSLKVDQRNLSVSVQSSRSRLQV